jgi:hypothetical protein
MVSFLPIYMVTAADDYLALKCPPTTSADVESTARVYDTSQRSTSLLRLPTEVRHDIFELVLHGGRFRQDVYGRRTTTDQSVTRTLTHHINSVLLVCKVQTDQ